VLAVSALYAVVSYGVTRRRHEIGVRMAVGADATDVVLLVVGEGLRLVVLGVAFGLGGVLALTRVLRGLLYEVSPLDTGILGGIVVLFALTSLAACYVPARRASLLDPLVATRAGPR
jgi:putative ABC transport system permease protein